MLGGGTGTREGVVVMLMGVGKGEPFCAMLVLDPSFPFFWGAPVTGGANIWVW